MQPGTTFGQYTILEPLGAGGMGVVYRALDTRLGRDVALKVLMPESNSDPTHRRRLLNEAKAASALNHPNTVTVYETGSVDGIDFIAMEYIRGETLAARIERGEIAIPEALSIALQVAEGLSAAHEAGLVHRDLKPSNIMSTRDGRAKILDFGLAKRSKTAVAAGATESQSLTMSGAVVGTLAYMSPEQARGEEPGPKSDVFAYGVVLYEMLCRERPFEGKTQLDLYHQICYEDPAPVTARRADIPPALAEITTVALAKKPEDRFESMAVVAQALRAMLFASGTATRPSVRPAKQRRVSWAVAALAIGTLLAGGYWFWSRPKPFDSVAVLPFVNATGDSSIDYLVEGLSDGLRRDLTRLNGLSVASPDAIQKYRGSGISPATVANQLRVSAVIAGKVSVRGESLHLDVAMTNASDGHAIWDQSYDVPRPKAVQMADRLWVDSAYQLGRKLRISKTRHTPPPKAYELYLKGQAALNQRGSKNDQQAVNLFQEAIEEDRDFALAYAGLTIAYNVIANYGEQPPATVFPNAKDAARRAIELDPTLAEAQLSYARTLLMGDFDWTGAEKAFRRAIELDPHSASSRIQFAANWLTPRKRFEEALIEAQRAVDLESAPVPRLILRADIEFFARHYDESLFHYSQIQAPAFQRFTAVIPALCLVAKGNPEQSIARLTNVTDSAQERGIQARITLALGYAYAAAGRRAEALRIAVESEREYQHFYFSPCSLASVYVPLGEFDRAMRWLNECRASGDTNLKYIGVDPRLDGIRADPRFRELVDKIGLN